ncbi:MAG: MaoC family dehydratase [Bacteroidota bacterium]
MYGRYFDDFIVGEVIEHSLRKTITECDNNFFCLLTMNHHPVHIDVEYASAAQHKKILVVGTYVFSLVVGLSVADVSGKAIANLEYEKILHHSPVFIGDTIRAVTTVLDVKESDSKSDRGVVYVKTNAYNQHDVIVLSFLRKVLIPKRCI